MLKNKFFGKKIRNIVILLMVIIVMIGAYKYIRDSRAENVIEIDAIALDNYEYLSEEEFKLEAKELEGGRYEIELPENINTKKVNKTIKICLIDSNGTESVLEIIENKIYLTKEQVENQKIKLEIVYDVAILEQQGENYEKVLLSEKSEEDRNQIQITEDTKTLYSKILRYEDKKRGKLVEVKGFLPKDARLQVEEVSEKKLKEIFGEGKIDVAYDIKIMLDVVTRIPVDEANPDSEIEEIIETIEINPEEFGEKCEVSIKDKEIEADSQVYHVKEDNTFEMVDVNDSTEENISFEAQTFSIYAVSSDEGIMTVAATTVGMAKVSVDGGTTWTGTTKETAITEASAGNITVYIKSSNATSILAYLADGHLAYGDAGGTRQAKITDKTTVNGESCFYYTFSNVAANKTLYFQGYNATDDVYGTGIAYIHVIQSDTTAPTVTISPNTTTYTNQSSITVTGTASDSGTGIDRVEVYGCYGTQMSGQSKKVTASYDSSTGKYSATLNFSELPDTSTGATGKGDGQYRIKAYAYDKSGNSASADSTAIYYDTTKPTASISATSPTSSSSVTVYVEATDALSGMDYVEIRGAYGNESMGGNYKKVTATYNSSTGKYSGTFNFSEIPSTASNSTKNGDGIYRFMAYAADKAGNKQQLSSIPVILDTTAPTATISPNVTTYTNGTSITVYATADDGTNGSGIERVDLQGWYGGSASGSNLHMKTVTMTYKNNRYEATLKFSDLPDITSGKTGNGDGEYRIKVYAYDNVGKTGSAGSVPIMVDTTGPSCTITANPSANPTNASSITYTFTFDDAVTGFTKDQISVTNGTKGTFSGSGTTYTLVVTNSGSCEQTVSVAAGAGKDSSGNGSSAASKTVTIDRTVPVWADSISGGTYSSSAKTYSFSLVGSDETSLNTSSSTLSTSKMSVKVDGSSASFSVGTASVSGNTKTFPITISNFTGGTISISINAGVLVDTAGNTSAAKNDYPSWTVDITSPKCTITANPSANPTNASSITYTFQFDEDVQNFITSDISVTNGTKGTFTKVSNSKYTLVVTNSGNCTQKVSIAAGACTDLSNNNNEAASKEVTIDRTVPVWNSNISNGTYSASAKTYTLNLTGSDESGLNNSSSTLSGNISVTVNGSTVSSSNLTVGAGNLNDKTKTFPVTIKNFTGGDVVISISAGALVDTAGNTSVAKSYSFSIDGTKPVWADEISGISYNKTTKAYTFNVVGSDETSLNTSSSTLSTSKMSVKVNGSSASFSVGTATVSGNTKTFPITISNFTGGTISVSINAGVLVDTAGNTSDAKTYPDFTADVTDPVWGTATGTYNPDDQSYTITVSGSDETKLNNTTSNLSTSNITLTVGGTTITPTVTTTSTTSTTENYQIKWSNHSGGAIVLNINAGALVDASSNTSAAKEYTFDAVDATKPTWNESISGGSYNWDTGEYSLSFIGTDNVGLNNTSSVLNSSNVTVKVGGSTVSSSNLVFGTGTLSADGKTKTFPLTIKNFAGGQVEIAISSGALVDTTGNKSNAKSPNYSFYLDITRPVWNESISDGLYDPDNKQYTFNIIGTDETALNSSSALSSYMTMTIGGTTTTDYSIGTATTSADNKTKTFPVTINNYTSEEEIVISISAGALIDTSNNTSLVKEYKFTPDISLPVWTYQNVIYDPDTRTYSLELVGTDETQLNTTLSTLITSGASKNVTVECGGTPVTPSATKLSTTSTQVVYKLTINSYPGGEVVININKGALIDTSSNQSIATEIMLDAKDITKPTWVAQNAEYSIADGTYTFELVATDNDKLDSSATLVTSGDNKNITIICKSTIETEVTPIITREISDSQIIYTVTIADYPGGIVEVTLDEGAAKDVTGNKSEADEFELPAEDIAKPVWQDNPTITYNYETKDLVIQLVGTDETSLNPDKTILTLLSNIVVNVGGSTLDSSRVQIVNGDVSADGLTRNYTITISNFTGGRVEISLSAGALEDMSGKQSDAKAYTFDDVIRPIWSMEGDGEYNKTEGSYTLTIKGIDETSLKTALLDNTNSTSTLTVVKDGATTTPTYEVTDITPESETSNSRTYSVKISSFTGGTISFGINAGALVDNGDNQSIAATFSVTPDIVSPTWTAQNAQYTNMTDNTITVELIGSDDVQLVTSTLQESDLTVMDGTTPIDVSNLSLSTVTNTEDGKGGVKYVLTIDGYTGGSLSIAIPEGTLEDASENVNDATTLTLGVIPPIDDDTPPVVTVVETGIDKSAEAIIITFDVTDDWFNFNETVTSDEFTVSKITTSWTGTTTTEITDAVVQITSETNLSNGKRFTIKVSNLGITSATTISVKLNANAVYDLAGNGNAETELYNASTDFSLTASDPAFIKHSVTLDETNKQLIIVVTGNTNNSWWSQWKPYSWSTTWDFGATEFQARLSDITIDGESIISLSNPSVTVTEITESNNSGSTYPYWRMGKLV